MKNKKIIQVVAALCSSLIFASANTMAAPERWNILMLGDSITEWGTSVIGGYPVKYAQELESIFGTDTTYTFIGRSGSGGVPREGYNGETSGFIRNILSPNNANGLHGYLQTTPPDVVLLHIGSNDNWKLKSADEVESNVRQIINQLKGFNPDVTVCLAKIIPWRALFLAPLGDLRVQQYNQRFQEIGNDTQNVTIVDQHSGYWPHFSLDGIHPNELGAGKMSYEWITQCPQVYMYE